MYLNRLSDLLWLYARKLEVDAGVSNSLREMNGSPARNGRAPGKCRRVPVSGHPSGSAGPYCFHISQCYRSLFALGAGDRVVGRFHLLPVPSCRPRSSQNRYVYQTRS